MSGDFLVDHGVVAGHHRPRRRRCLLPQRRRPLDVGQQERHRARRHHQRRPLCHRHLHGRRLPATGKSPITTPCAQPVPSTSIDGWTRRHRPTRRSPLIGRCSPARPRRCLVTNRSRTVVQPDTTGLKASQEHIMFGRRARAHPAQQAGLRSEKAQTRASHRRGDPRFDRRAHLRRNPQRQRTDAHHRDHPPPARLHGSPVPASTSSVSSTSSARSPPTSTTTVPP